MRKSRLRKLALVMLLAATSLSTVPDQIPADYTITNDAEWGTIPAGLLSGGGIIDVAGGDYAVVTLSNLNPSSELIFRQRSWDADRPTLRIVFSNVSNLTFQNFWFLSESWQASPDPCIKLTNTTETIVFEDCEISGNYRGTRSPVYDPLDQLPEMNGIYGTVAAGGVSFDTTYSGNDAKWIGDRLAAGTGYSAVVTATGGTGASCTFDVDGSGNISITAQTAGSGYTDTRDAMYTVRLPDGGSGMRVLRELMPDGVEADGSHVNDGITFRRCTFDMLNNAARPNYPQNGVGTGSLLFEDCVFTRIYMDYIAGGAQETGLRDIRLVNCFMTTPFGLALDMQNPHGDALQTWDDQSAPDQTTADSIDVSVEGGIIIIGPARGAPQGLFLTDKETGIRNHNYRVAGLTVLTDGSWPIRISNSSGCYIYRCIAALYNVANYSTTATIYLQGNIGEPSFVGDCIAEAYSLNANDISSGNITLTAHNSSSYSTVFADPHSTPETAAEVETAFTPNIAYAGKGPWGDGYITNGRVDRTMEPTVVIWSDQVNATLSDSIESGWSLCLNGGPLTGRTFTVNTGTLWEADDAAGTGATQLTSPFSLTPGKYYEARHTASGSPGTAVTQTFTASDSSASLTFASTTAAVVAGFRAMYGNGTTNVTVGDYYEVTIDVGASDAAREVTLFTLTSTNNIAAASDVTINTNACTRQTTATGKVQCFTYALGAASGATTATLRITNNSAGTWGQIQVAVFVSYPSSGTPVDAVEGAVASGTSTSTASDVSISNGGHMFCAGGYASSGGSSPLAPTWNGTDTLVEDYDASIEGAPFWVGHVVCTETNTTRDLALPANGSGSKTILAISWGPPA